MSERGIKIVRPFDELLLAEIKHNYHKMEEALKQVSKISHSEMSGNSYPSDANNPFQQVRRIRKLSFSAIPSNTRRKE